LDGKEAFSVASSLVRLHIHLASRKTPSTCIETAARLLNRRAQPDFAVALLRQVHMPLFVIGFSMMQKISHDEQ
jgi:hypothetical protein